MLRPRVFLCRQFVALPNVVSQNERAKAECTEAADLANLS